MLKRDKTLDYKALHVSAPMLDSTIRMVLSSNGRVVLEDALKIGTSPSRLELAYALRFFADRLAEQEAPEAD
jgi:hypothetical protein